MRVLVLLLILTGLLSAKELELYAVVVGKVDKVYVKEGQKVKEGQLLLKIDPVIYLAQRKSVEGRIEEIKARLWKVERDYNRLKELFERDLLAETRFEDQKILYDTIKAQLKQAEGELMRVEAFISFTRIYAPVKGTIKRVLSPPGSYVNGELKPHVVIIMDVK